MSLPPCHGFLWVSLSLPTAGPGSQKPPAPHPVKLSWQHPQAWSWAALREDLVLRYGAGLSLLTVLIFD